MQTRPTSPFRTGFERSPVPASLHHLPGVATRSDRKLLAYCIVTTIDFMQTRAGLFCWRFPTLSVEKESWTGLHIIIHELLVLLLGVTVSLLGFLCSRQSRAVGYNYTLVQGGNRSH